MKWCRYIRILLFVIRLLKFVYQSWIVVEEDLADLVSEFLRERVRDDLLLLSLRKSARYQRVGVHYPVILVFSPVLVNYQDGHSDQNYKLQQNLKLTLTHQVDPLFVGHVVHLVEESVE